MTLFSMDWFKSEKTKHFEELQLKEQKLKNKLLKKKLKENLNTVPVQPDKDNFWKNVKVNEIHTFVPEPKPYMNVKLINDMLTITLENGDVIVKPQATQEDFEKVRNATTEEEILILTRGKEVVEEIKKEQREYEKAVALKDGIDKLAKFADFEIRDDSVYLKGIDRSLPQLLVEKFLEIVNKSGTDKLLQENKEYQSLKWFFMWCCLNPRAEVADMLYDFLVKNSFRITKQGFFVALRNVVNVAEKGERGSDLLDFISNSYNKVKAVWKKNPAHYTVLDNDGVYSLGKISSEDDGQNVSLGNLQQLYLDMPSMESNRFTDAHTHTFDIRVGKVVNMPKEECNWSLQDCAHAGLHFTADEINYVGCGDTSVLILINPMKVVGIGRSKGRCYEYLPIMTVPREESTTILHDLDFDTLELDEQYAIDELNDLENRVKEGFAVEAKKHQFNIPQINSVQVNKIVKSLNQMKNEIKSRVQKAV